MKNCPSCHTEFKGRYCYQCGEKKVVESDFTLKHIFGEGFSFITNLDSKLYRTFVGLMFKPGFLVNEYLEGKRNVYMKPFQVFILASILFFIFLSGIDLLLIPSKWFFTDHTRELINGLLQEKNISQEMLAQMYDAKVVSNSKLYIFILLPVLAFFLFIFNRKRQKEFGKYVIHALYMFSFFMVMLVMVTIFFDLIPLKINKWWVILSAQLLQLLYIMFSIKNVYDRTLGQSILQGLVVTLLLGFLLGMYRYGISYFTLSNL